MDTMLVIAVILGGYLLIITVVLVFIIHRAKQKNRSLSYAHITQTRPIPCDYELLKAQVPFIEEQPCFFENDKALRRKKPLRERRDVPKIVLDGLRSNAARIEVFRELETNSCIHIEEEKYQPFGVEDVERKRFDGSSDSYSSLFEDPDELTPPRSPRSPLNFLKKQRTSLKKLRKKLSGNKSSDD